MSTIDENWNIVDVTRAFCQKVLPLVYDESLSYMEMICKMSSKLNEVIENNNNLPQYVKDLIKEIVDSDEFTQIVGSVLMNTIINVKFPPEGITPAKGDGVTDDTKSIQDCLDYANAQGGAVVFFPSGRYLTGTLSVNSKTSIMGADRYNTTLFLKGGGNTPLLQGVIHQSVRNIALDGNRLNQIEENYLIDGDIENALIDNIILEDSAHCITSEKCNGNEFCNVKVLDIGDNVFIDAIGNNNLLTNINTEYSIVITGDNNNWQSHKETKIDSAEPLVYQQPQKLNAYFNYVTMQHNGYNYNVLVSGDNLDALAVNYYVPVEYFGAKGDGVTDDTEAIQSALNYADENIIIVMTNNYVISDTLTINSTTTIKGSQKGKILSNGQNTVFDIQPGGERSLFSGLNIKSNGLAFNIMAPQIEISNCYFNSHSSTQCILNHRSNIRLNNNHFDIYSGVGVGFLADTNYYLINCSVSNNYFGGPGDSAIVIYPTEENSMRPEGISIENNRMITTGPKTINIYSGLAIRIINNIIDQSKTYGVCLSITSQDVDDVSISFNFFGQTGEYSAGVAVIGGHSATRLNVIGNTFFNTYNGVYYMETANVKTSIISENNFNCTSHALYVLSFGKIIITNNQMLFNTVPVSGSGQYCVMCNNISDGALSVQATNLVNENNINAGA